MERPSFDELISAWFDDETSPEESAVVERLLADPKHRQALEDYRQLRDELRSLPAPRLDSDWSARLKQRLVAAKPDWATKTVAASAPVVPLTGAAPTELQTGGPMPAALDRSHRDGYARFRHLWLTAGVGVAAGTLGIVIGWSSQMFAPGEVAYDFGSDATVSTTASPAPTAAAPMPWSASPMPMSAVPPPWSAEAVAGQEGLLRSKTEAEFAFDNEPTQLAQTARTMPDDAEAPVDRSTAAFGAILPHEAADVESAPRRSRMEGLAEAEEASLAADKLTGEEAWERKKSEKQSDLRSGAIPDVRRSADLSGVSGNLEGEGLARDATGDPRLTRYYATYVGVWDSTGGDLSSNQIRGMTRQADSAAADRATEPAGLTAWQALDDSLWAEEAPALVLEGSPERVAEALEILSRGRSNRQVRLLERVEDSNVLAYYRRSRQLSEVEPLLGEPLAAIDGQSERSGEGAFDIKGDGRQKDRSAGGGASKEALALGATERGSSSAIDRIEAFFDDESREKSLSAESSPSSGGLPGGFAYGGGGFGGSGLYAGGFGGLGGGAAPPPSASGPEPAPVPTFDSPAETPLADAFNAPAGRPNLASRSTPVPVLPAPVADDERAQLAESGPVSGAAPQSGPAGPGSAAGAPATTPPPRPAMAGEPVPLSPAPAAAPAIASALAESDTPPPAATPSAEVAKPTDPASSSGIETSDGKSNRFAENASGGALPMERARGARGDDEDGIDEVPADQPAGPEAPGAARGMRSLAEKRLALESLHERSESAELEKRAGTIRNFAAPAPERVRVILFAADSLRLRVPTAEGAPAESAPAPDR